MKICNKCQQEKDQDQFNKKRTKKDGSFQLQPFCRSCQKEYWNSYYKIEEKKQKHLARKYKHDKTKYENVKKYIDELKSKPCTDCKQKFSPWIMDFDHVGFKIENISVMRRNKVPLDKILEEISKCELVCSNCHRDRTYKRIHSGVA